jgi:hypothetical protein
LGIPQVSWNQRLKLSSTLRPLYIFLIANWIDKMIARYTHTIYILYIYILPKYELPHLWPYFSPRIHGSFMFNNVHTSTSQKWLASSVMSTSSTSKNTDLPDFGFSRWCRDHVVFYDAALPNGAWQHATCHPRHDTATRRHGDMTPSSKKIYRIFSPPLSRKK